jgi:hypothetical protein
MFTWRLAPCSSLLVRCTFSNSIPLLCVSFQFLVYCSIFVFAGWGLPVCPCVYAVLS